MDFRWKNYQPNEQPVNMGGQAAFDASERAELSKLKGELASIDAQIAQFDRENPGFGSGLSEVAAKRAEAGDMGAYDAMVNNAMNSQLGAVANQRSATEAVYNHVNEARKLASAIDDKSSEFRAEKMDNIRVSLDEAKRKAEAAGIELPKEWYELDRKYKDSVSERNRGGLRAEAMDNALYTKLNNGTLSDDDIKGMEWYIAQYPNDDRSTEYRSIIEKYKNKTNEKKEEYKRKKAEAESYYNSWNTNRSVIAKKAEWAKLLKENHPVTIFFELNEFGNPVRKKRK